MAKSNQRGRNNNNAEGRNQFSNGWMDTAKDKPFTTAAAAAAAVGAGVFLWSRRNQISDQINTLSGQLYDWADERRAGSSSGELEMAEGVDEFSAIESPRSTKRRSSIGSRTSAKRSTGSTPRGTSGQPSAAAQDINPGSAGAGTFNS